MIDFYASEPHFVDHAAPVWLALPAELRGAFTVPTSLLEHARWQGVDTGRRSALERPVLVASYGDHKRARLAGRKRFVRLEHGIGQSYVDIERGNYAGGRDCSDVELFLCPNVYSAARWRAVYPNAETAIVGSARLDTLAARGRGRSVPPKSSPTVAVSFHWDCSLTRETGSAFRHFMRALPDLASTFHLIGHAHPRKIQAVAGHYRRAGIELMTDFADVLEQADLYVCDNSSTIYEFAALRGPVVVLNAPEYRRDVEHGGRFWRWADVGIQVDRPEDLAAAVAVAMTDPKSIATRREEVVSEVFSYRGYAGELAARALMRHFAAEAVAA